MNANDASIREVMLNLLELLENVSTELLRTGGWDNDTHEAVVAFRNRWKPVLEDQLRNRPQAPRSRRGAP